MDSNTSKNRWKLDKNSGITWSVKDDKNIPHTDHLEMSGQQISFYVEYGIDKDGELTLLQRVVFPRLRTIPNNTHASLSKEYNSDQLPIITANGDALSHEKPYEITFDGILAIKSRTAQNIIVERRFFPAREDMAAVQRITLKNDCQTPVTIMIPAKKNDTTHRGVHGIYCLDVETVGAGEWTLNPGATLSVSMIYSGRKIMDELPRINVTREEEKRRAFIQSVLGSLVLETPNPTFNQAFAFAKIRAAESVFQTKGGLMHSPGGLAFYAGVWTNDQAEYAGPFFPFLGDSASIEASLNCYRLYMPFMGPSYEPIPTSIISEGVDIWEGAGDRGDAAMYAYGAARFALSMGDKAIAEELWSAIVWCLTFCKKKLNADGVIASDSDELEGRFPSGSANLCTSALTYGALQAAASLGRALGKDELAKEYDKFAKKLSAAIERYFGANMNGFETYRYYEGNETLRSWICLPLTMGIMERKVGTIEALFSPSLWTEDGLATEEGDEVFWDRSTLYGFRGVIFAGEKEKALPFLTSYSERRTLGEHVPYAVEAYPEGNQRHLSAESALYCRIFTEGFFGITPIGLSSFTCKPNIPNEWEKMSLKAIKAFGTSFDLAIEHTEIPSQVKVTVTSDTAQTYLCHDGEEVTIHVQKEKII